MKRQAIVVGLGQFGMALARSLTDIGVDVLAVDRDMDRVELAAERVADAVCLDATDEDALAETRPADRDLAICAIGDESRDASIVVTALLRQLGAKRVVARATDRVHDRILRLVGAEEVINPEEAFGARLATHLVYRSIQDEIELGEQLTLSEVEAPEAFVGRTLAELALPRRHGLTVVAIRDPERSGVELPTADRRVRDGELLIVVSRPGGVAEMMEKLS